MNKFTTALIALVATASSALAASGVAELAAVQGKVLVNQGEGFVAVTGPVALNAGARVMVGEDGSALISYLGSDCKISVAASSISTVADIAPCAAGQVVGQVDGMFVAPVADLDYAAPAPLLFVPLLAGAAAVGVAVLVLTQDEEDAPVSVPPT